MRGHHVDMHSTCIDVWFYFGNPLLMHPCTAFSKRISKRRLADQGLQAFGICAISMLDMYND
eukprot:scaffold166939_cov20-Prasinocladus_malaysianus.AAC.1